MLSLLPRHLLVCIFRTSSKKLFFFNDLTSYTLSVHLMQVVKSPSKEVRVPAKFRSPRATPNHFFALQISDCQVWRLASDYLYNFILFFHSFRSWKLSETSRTPFWRVNLDSGLPWYLPPPCTLRWQWHTCLALKPLACVIHSRTHIVLVLISSDSQGQQGAGGLRPAVLLQADGFPAGDSSFSSGPFQ